MTELVLIVYVLNIIVRIIINEVVLIVHNRTFIREPIDVQNEMNTIAG